MVFLQHKAKFMHFQIIIASLYFSEPQDIITLLAIFSRKLGTSPRLVPEPQDSALSFGFGLNPTRMETGQRQRRRVSDTARQIGKT